MDYLMLTDETNMQPSANAEFFIYGGIFFPISTLSLLNDRIQEIRDEAGYRPGDTFKFDTRAKPSYVSRDQVNHAKSQVLDACQEFGVQFIAHLILHQIVSSQPQDQRVLWAVDYVIARFNRFLAQGEHQGICVVDNLPARSQWSYFSERYANGLELPGGRRVALDRIQLFAATTIGASHANSIMDIVLGSFRYCVNNPQNEGVARDVFPRVVDLMWHRTEGDTRHVRDYGLILRPRIEDIRCGNYRSRYESLIERMYSMMGSDSPDAPGQDE